MNRKWLVATAVFLAIASVWWYADRDAPIPVKLVAAQRGSVERTVSNTRAGTVKACRRAALSMPGGGRVAALYVKEGDTVAAGTLLLELWNDDRKAMLLQAESQLAATSHRREQMCVEADNAQREAARLVSLQQRKLVSLEAREAAETRARASRFACQGADDEQQTATATVKLQQALLTQTQLHAPFAGIVAEINGEIGEYVTPSPPGIPMPPAVDLIDYSCLYVNAPIDEVDAGLLHEGLSARINLDAFRGEAFEGTLDRIAPYVLEVEKQARTVAVDVLFSRPQDRQRLLVGYTADVDLILESRPEVLRIPSEALLDDDTVYRYQPASGRILRTSVQIGIRNWSFAQILGGLDEGDRIVVSLDQPGLEDGVAVMPEND